MDNQELLQENIDSLESPAGSKEDVIDVDLQSKDKLSSNTACMIDPEAKRKEVERIWKKAMSEEISPGQSPSECIILQDEEEGVLKEQVTLGQSSDKRNSSSPDLEITHIDSPPTIVSSNSEHSLEDCSIYEDSSCAQSDVSVVPCSDSQTDKQNNSSAMNGKGIVDNKHKQSYRCSTGCNVEESGDLEPQSKRLKPNDSQSDLPNIVQITDRESEDMVIDSFDSPNVPHTSQSSESLPATSFIGPVIPAHCQSQKSSSTSLSTGSNDFTKITDRKEFPRYYPVEIYYSFEI